MTQPALISRSQVIADFLVLAGWDTAEESGYMISTGNEGLAAPDRLLSVTMVSGPGFVTEEGSADALAFQARLRGAADSPLETEAAAWQLDAMILTAPVPVTVDGVRVHACHRMAGGPAALPLDPRDRRFEFTCNYVIVTSPPMFTGV